MLSEKVLELIKNKAADIESAVGYQSYDDFNKPEVIKLGGRIFSQIGLVALAEDNPDTVEDKHLLELIDSTIEHLQKLKLEVSEVISQG